MRRRRKAVQEQNGGSIPGTGFAIEDFQPVYDWENAADFSTPTVFYRKLNVSSPKQHRAAATGRRFGF
jgi:hypothetical protein